MSNDLTAQAEQEAKPEAADGGAASAEPSGEPASVQTDPAARVQELEAALEAARAACEEQREQVLRARADADNVRKRAERDLENAHRYALERFVAELLPVKDSLELGLAAAAETTDVERLREGTEATLRLFSAAIQKFGVEEVDPSGAPFDPERHQAMTTRESETVESGTVLEVIQKGYLLNERLVRPALVVVAK